MDGSSLLRDPVVTAIGLTLVHFAWQGTLVAVLLAVIQMSFRRHGPNLQYVAGCVAMFTMALCPIATLVVLLPHRAETTIVFAPSMAPTYPPATPMDRLEPYLPWLVAVWLLGVVIGCTRLVMGWHAIQQLRHRDASDAPPAFVKRLDDLKQRLGIRRAVTLLISRRVEVPSTVGWLRPTVLLPTAALTGLPIPLLEALIAHELAHIRRHDYLVNLIQSVVEAVLFYHPAVWWVSHQIRTTRELCCDDLAVKLVEDPMQYARALTSMEEMRTMKETMALAGNGGFLLARIRRVLGLPAPASNSLAIWLVGSMLAWVLLVALPGRAGSQAAPVPPAPAVRDTETTPEAYIASVKPAPRAITVRTSGSAAKSSHPAKSRAAVPPRPADGMARTTGTVTLYRAESPSGPIARGTFTVRSSASRPPSAENAAAEVLGSVPDRPLSEAEIKAMTARFEHLLRARSNLAKEARKLDEDARKFDLELSRVSPDRARALRMNFYGGGGGDSYTTTLAAPMGGGIPVSAVGPGAMRSGGFGGASSPQPTPEALTPIAKADSAADPFAKPEPGGKSAPATPPVNPTGSAGGSPATP